MACKAAKATDEYHGWECEITVCFCIQIAKHVLSYMEKGRMRTTIWMRKKSMDTQNKSTERRKLSKAERQQVYEKCNGHCAYCGIEIEYKDMQVDHATPLRVGGADVMENMLPACRSCNHYKATLTVEGFREYIGGIPDRLERDSIPYQVGKRFGIVKRIYNLPTFYFEQMADYKWLQSPVEV